MRAARHPCNRIVASRHADGVDGHAVWGRQALTYAAFHSRCPIDIARQESVMKKLIPFVFFAVMAGLIGAKVAVATEAPVAQVEIRQ
jgi:hypothetical protein